MNSSEDNIPEENARRDEHPGRPLGFWLRVVDARITRELNSLLGADGLDRRDWMILNAIAGTVPAGPLSKRLERGGRRIGALGERGWVAGSPGSWTLTDEGRAAVERIGVKVAEFRTRVAGAVPAEDFATTLATLQAIAAELGEAELGEADGSGRRWRRKHRYCGHAWRHHHGHERWHAHCGHAGHEHERGHGHGREGTAAEA